MSERGTAITKLERYLSRYGLPRLQMMTIVVTIGLVGFAVSFALLTTGVQSMPARYAAASGSAYLTFLVLVRAWLAYQRRHLGIEDILSTRELEPTPSSMDGSGWFDSFDFPDILPDEGLVGCLTLLLIISTALSVFYVVSSAPALLAEALLDVALVSGLYRRLRAIESRHWLDTVVRRTALPFAIVTVLLIASGWAIQRVHPEIDSIGDFRSSTNRGASAALPVSSPSGSENSVR